MKKFAIIQNNKPDVLAATISDRVADGWEIEGDVHGFYNRDVGEATWFVLMSSNVAETSFAPAVGFTALEADATAAAVNHLFAYGKTPDDAARALGKNRITINDARSYIESLEEDDHAD